MKQEPLFIASPKLGCSFTLGYDNCLMWYGLENETINKNRRIYFAVQPGHFTEEEKVELAKIKQQLLCNEVLQGLAEAP